MIDVHDELYNDLEAVRQIPIVPHMLEVICQLTGMGFATIARVTNNRWLACSVRDEVQFGLKEGGELQIETTICNEIRDSHQAVIIDHVDADEHFKEHHTPKMYGLQSYISFPIILKSGEFFGTLCAIDSKPAKVKDPKITGTFTLFAELLSFHLQSLDILGRNHSALQETNRQLKYTNNENVLYQQISDHNLQEPLRKIKLFSDILIHKIESDDMTGAKKTAEKINSFAEELTAMMQQVNQFSHLSSRETETEKVDLNQILLTVCTELGNEFQEKNISIDNGELPTISAIREQMRQLFYQLLYYTATFAHHSPSPLIKIYSKNMPPDSLKLPLLSDHNIRFCEVLIELKGMQMEKHQIENMFNIFVHQNKKQSAEQYTAGLAYSRKIVHNHGGDISVQSIPSVGTSFSIVLPLD